MSEAILDNESKGTLMLNVTDQRRYHRELETHSQSYHKLKFPAQNTVTR